MAFEVHYSQDHCKALKRESKTSKAGGKRSKDMKSELRTSNKKPRNRTKESSQIAKIVRSENSRTPERHKSE